MFNNYNPENPFVVSGWVVKGYKEGRALGFPTANLEIARAVDLPEGIYGGYARIIPEQKAYPSVIFWGKPYTLPDIKEPRFEVHILQKDIDVYGKMLEVKIIFFVRENKLFSDREGLKKAMKGDLEQAFTFFKLKSNNLLYV